MPDEVKVTMQPDLEINTKKYLKTVGFKRCFVFIKRRKKFFFILLFGAINTRFL